MTSQPIQYDPWSLPPEDPRSAYTPDANGEYDDYLISLAWLAEVLRRVAAQPELAAQYAEDLALAAQTLQGELDGYRAAAAR